MSPWGDFKVIIRRQSKISQLLSGTNQNIASIFGPVTDGDQLFIISQPFFDSLGFDRLKDFLLDDRLSHYRRKFFIFFLYSLEDQTKHTSALIQVHQESDIPVEAQESIPSKPNPPAVSTDPSPQVYVRRHSGFKINHHKKFKSPLP